MKTELRILTRIALAGSLALLVVCASYARPVKKRNHATRSQFETAERLREALEGSPESQRTRRDYQNVMEAYRKVYHTAPKSKKADAAVLAVADLMKEQGRVLDDSQSYMDAIGQLVFLRRAYPGSKYRADALFTIGEIFRDDIRDSADAKATFQDYLKRYPNSRLAPQARQALKEIAGVEAGGTSRRKSARLNGQGEPHTTGAKAAWAHTSPPRPSEERALSHDRADAMSTETEPDSGADHQDLAASRAENAQPHRMARLTSVRHWSTPDYTRVAIDLEQEVQYQFGRVPHPDRIFFDLMDTKVAGDLVGKSFEVEAGFLRRIRVAQYKPNMARVVLDVNDVAEYSAFLLPNPYRLIIDIHGRVPAQPTTAHPQDNAVSPGERAPASDDVTVTQLKPETPAIQRPEKSKSATTQETRTAQVETAKLDPPRPSVDDPAIDDESKISSKPTSGPTFQAIAPQQSSRNRRMTDSTRGGSNAASHVAAPTASGDRSLIRALGLKIGKIVVDAGHGGHDTGTIGPTGLMEKDLVLDVGLKLGKLLEKKLGAEVVYTRADDTFIPLETRTAIANKEQADLFISIHANNTSDHSARGVETYYLNFTSSPDALEVAARENAVSEKSIHELQDLVKKIALKEKIEESREFAADVQHSLYQVLNARNPGVRNRGVKKAPFVVLIGANMPSILTEISFVSNPADEKRLKTSEYRQSIADALYKGISKYIGGLSGVKVASKLQEDESPRGATAVAAK